MAPRKPKYDIVKPDPETLLQSARSFGYSIETAIADLIDNSITAKADKIRITYGIDRSSSFVRIEDNGKGMTENLLINAMKVGSFNPLNARSQTDLGRFGLGLKTASFSQCRRLTVKTRTRSNIESVRCWDLDIIAKKRDWILLRDYADKTSEKNAAVFFSKSAGTIVLWEKLDRLIETGELTSDKEHFYRKFDNVRKHLGITFHRFIEDGELSISVNNEEVKAINPFHISISVPSTELQQEQLSIRTHDITIQPFILPHESKLSLDEKKELQIIKGWTEHQGIYLYRNRRLISDGTWLDLNFRKRESQRLCRIAIDIPNTLDIEWQIDVKKASAKVPDVIRKKVQNVCLQSIERAIKVYTHRGAYVKRTGQKKDIIYFWLGKQKNGKRFFSINEKHPIYLLLIDLLEDNNYILRDFLKLVGETLPVNMIVNDFSEANVTMKSFFEHESEELKKIYNNMINALIDAGVSKEEAAIKLAQLESFQNLK